jgi:hypothetical protein
MAQFWTIVRTLGVFLLIGSILHLIPIARADIGIPPETVLARFTIAKAGEPVRIPVRINKRDYVFSVDTGTRNDFRCNVTGRGVPEGRVISLNAWLWQAKDEDS